MKKFYNKFIRQFVPVTVVLVLSAAVSVVAQQNDMQILPVGNSVINATETGTGNFPIFVQPFTSERKNMSDNQPVQEADFPVFTQQFSTKTEKLGEINPALTTVSTVALDFGGKEFLSVVDDKAISVQAFVASEGPIGTPDFYAVPSDKILSIAAPGFLANDIDLEGEALSGTSLVDNVDNGTLNAFIDGSFSYAPNPGFTGTDAFIYQMQDASGNLSDPVTVTIEVLPAANRNPIGVPDNYALSGGTTLSASAPGFLTNDIDPEGETISGLSLNDDVDNGTLNAFTSGSFTYTPNAGFTGTDQFVYTMIDASGNMSDPVTVTLYVYAVNRPPVGVDDHYATVINTSLTISAPGFLSNDVELDGETITGLSLNDNVDNGSLNAFTSGSFTYTPNTGFTGTDQFVYTMIDASGNVSDPVTVTIFVSPSGTTPVGVPDNYAVPNDQTLSIAAPGFLSNDIDPDGETLTGTSLLDDADNGTLNAFTSGSFTYTPNPGFTGTDQFIYQMQDASANLSDPVTVTITVLPPANRNPIGIPDYYAVLAGTTLSVSAPGFLTNDIDPDGETISGLSLNDNVDNGTLNAFTSGSFTYTPNAGFTGTDQFVYTMIDASGNVSDPVTVTIEVYPGNRSPYGIEDHYAALMNTPLVVDAPGFLGNDVDLEGETLTGTSLEDNVDNGTLNALTSGSFTYTPNTGFTGTDQFIYRMVDASGNLSEPVPVTIKVYLTNQPPVADAGADQNIECTGSEFYAVILDGSNSTDPDSDPLIYTWRLNGNIIAGPSADPTVQVQLPLGNHEIELTVEDSYGETSTDIVVVVIEDTTAPTFTAPGDIVIAKTEDCSYDASPAVTGEATDLFDECDADLQAVYTDVVTGGECIGQEIITRTWTVTDDAGNSTSHVQIITAEDQTPPVIQVPEDKIICMEAFPDVLTGTWTDNCSAGGEATATGEWYSETDCTTTYAYVFQVTDDCGNEAMETVYLTREAEVFSNCETAYAYLGEDSRCFLKDKFKNWGWTNYIEPSESPYTMELHAAGGQCSTDKGYQAGTVEVLYNNNNVTVTYQVIEGYVIHEAHIYVGCDKYPLYKEKETISPGKYSYNTNKLDKINEVSVTFTDVQGGIYFIAHATVCEILCECSTSEYSSFSDEMYLGINCPGDNKNDPSLVNDEKDVKSGYIADQGPSLLKVYPNPFSNRLQFEFTTNEDAHAALVIYNVMGQKVETLLERFVRKGEVINASFIPGKKVSGVYMYRLVLDGNVRTGKVIYNPGD